MCRRDWQGFELGEKCIYFEGKKDGDTIPTRYVGQAEVIDLNLYCVRLKVLHSPQPLAAASQVLLQVLPFVQSPSVELIPSFKPWFQHHLLLQGFSSQLYPPSPNRHHSHCHITPSPPPPLSRLLPSYLIGTSIYISVLGCPEDFILLNTVSTASRGLPGPR